MTPPFSASGVMLSCSRNAPYPLWTLCVAPCGLATLGHGCSPDPMSAALRIIIIPLHFVDGPDESEKGMLPFCGSLFHKARELALSFHKQGCADKTTLAVVCHTKGSGSNDSCVRAFVCVCVCVCVCANSCRCIHEVYTFCEQSTKTQTRFWPLKAQGMDTIPFVPGAQKNVVSFCQRTTDSRGLETGDTAGTAAWIVVTFITHCSATAREAASLLSLSPEGNNPQISLTVRIMAKKLGESVTTVVRCFQNVG